MSSLLQVALAGFGVLFVVTGVLGMLERLPKNDWVGIRMDEVMRDERTWLEGHRAGGPWVLAAGVVALLAEAVVLVVRPAPAVASSIATAGLLAAFLAAGIAGVVAQAAARKVRRRDD